jgi:hypothetical protein
MIIKKCELFNNFVVAQTELDDANVDLPNIISESEYVLKFRSRMMTIFLSNGTFYVICDLRAVLGPNSKLLYSFVWNARQGYL